VKKPSLKSIALVSVTAIALVSAAGVGAQASGLIGSKDIRDGGVHRVDLSPSIQKSLTKAGTPGKTGPKGDAGKDGISGLYYQTAAYGTASEIDPGVGVNEGAIATVACTSPTDVAISGGVQTLGLGGKSAAVASSFPGRMDWSNNTPKADRLDGWIVQFDARVAPEKATIWVLCAPDADVPVINTVVS